jgi:hypothetical protein
VYETPVDTEAIRYNSDMLMRNQTSGARI